ncbi:AAA family ATPase [uncultured Modestobacter sp.]|uniref:AAA family ATPase n=1 Tax=uncultured Modestobacter sp. TaxID=380048 RepID=UPI002602E098|nr:AAA family ATPase [uncultured Modestobacter sp.]
MILWLHGAFGAGKTSVAAELCRRRPELVPFDPELVGYLVRRSLPVPTGDFQDLPEWRRLVAASCAVLEDGGRRTVVTPMTLLREELARELFDGLADRGVQVRHVLLDVAEAELVRRIRDDGAEPGARDWRLSHVPTYAVARPWLTALADGVVDTTGRTVDQVADEVTGALSW